MPGGVDAESLLRSLMENIPGAIYRAANDDVRTVLTVSAEIEAITGYPADEFYDGSKLDGIVFDVTERRAAEQLRLERGCWRSRARGSSRRPTRRGAGSSATSATARSSGS